MAKNMDEEWGVQNPPIGKWLMSGLVLAAVSVGLAVAGTAAIRGPASDVREFLQAHLADPNVKATESGLQYEILREGEGAHPTAADTVVVHYEGRLADGTVFDSSYERGQPAVFGVSDVIPGWAEGVQLMRPGGKAQFVIPPSLGYGARGAGGVIPPNAVLQFDVELLDILPRQ